MTEISATLLDALPLSTKSSSPPMETVSLPSQRFMIHLSSSEDILFMVSARTISCRWRCGLASGTFRTRASSASPSLLALLKILSQDPSCKKHTAIELQTSCWTEQMQRELASLSLAATGVCDTAVFVLTRMWLQVRSEGSFSSTPAPRQSSSKSSGESDATVPE